MSGYRGLSISDEKIVPTCDNLAVTDADLAGTHVRAGDGRLTVTPFP